MAAGSPRGWSEPFVGGDLIQCPDRFAGRVRKAQRVNVWRSRPRHIHPLRFLYQGVMFREAAVVSAVFGREHDRVGTSAAIVLERESTKGT